MTGDSLVEERSGLLMDESPSTDAERGDERRHLV
jgi:hypothetical protein